MKSEPEDTGCFLIYLDYNTIINLLFVLSLYITTSFTW